MMQEVKNKNFKKNRYNSKEINIFCTIILMN